MQFSLEPAVSPRPLLASLLAALLSAAPASAKIESAVSLAPSTTTLRMDQAVTMTAFAGLKFDDSGGVGKVSAGAAHTCAVTSTGGVMCWGNNIFGQLGDGTTTGSRVPVSVLGLNGPVTAVAAGSGHTCALMDSGAVYCWGRNQSGQLGNGASGGFLPEPVKVNGLFGVKGIAAGSGFTCAIRLAVPLHAGETMEAGNWE